MSIIANWTVDWHTKMRHRRWRCILVCRDVCSWNYPNESNSTWILFVLANWFKSIHQLNPL